MIAMLDACDLITINAHAQKEINGANRQEKEYQNIGNHSANYLIR